MTLATLWENDDEQSDLHQLATHGVRIVARHLGKPRALWNSLIAVPSTTPLQPRYCWHPGLAQAIGKLVRNEPFDAIHVRHLRGAAYGLHLKRLLRCSESSFRNLQLPFSIPPSSGTASTASHTSLRRPPHKVTTQRPVDDTPRATRTRRYEGWLTRQFEHVLVTSAIDKAALETLRLTQDPKTSQPHPHLRPGKRR